MDSKTEEMVEFGLYGNLWLRRTGTRRNEAEGYYENSKDDVSAGDSKELTCSLESKSWPIPNTHLLFFPTMLQGL